MKTTDFKIMLDTNCDNCKFSNMSGVAILECRRHSPIVIANPRYPDSDHRVTLTEYPRAYGSCGEFEVVPSSIPLQVPESPVEA